MEQCQLIDNHLVENWSRPVILLVLLWSEWGKKRSPQGSGAERGGHPLGFVVSPWGMSRWCTWLSVASSACFGYNAYGGSTNSPKLWALRLTLSVDGRRAWCCAHESISLASPPGLSDFSAAKEYFPTDRLFVDGGSGEVQRRSGDNGTLHVSGYG